jgi:RecB family exonuclease
MTHEEYIMDKDYLWKTVALSTEELAEARFNDLIDQLVLDRLEAFADTIKSYDWQLEDNINANDVVAEQVDYDLETQRKIVRGDGEE